jgi:hypothetical protein
MGPDVWQKVLLATDETLLPRERVVATNFTCVEAAEAVLEAISDWEPAFAELRAASQRPYSRFNITYEQPDPASILLPHLSVLRQISRLASLRTGAELMLGRADAAFADVRLMLRLAEATRDEPILVSQMVRVQQFELVVQHLPDGINQWSEPQLRALQEVLGSCNFCADACRTLKSECFLFGNRIIEYTRGAWDKPMLMSAMGSGGGNNVPEGLELAGILMSIAPDGWFDLEHVNYTRKFEEWLLPIFSPRNRLVHPSATRRAEAGTAALLKHSAPGLYLRHRFFCGLLLPSIAKVSEKIAFAQAAADTAAIACALERYRRNEGKFPDALASLIPEFMSQLPLDVLNGQPLKYRRTEDGLYVLYSAGWNETDDGGKVEVTRGGELDRQRGDWVWRPRPR